MVKDTGPERPDRPVLRGLLEAKKKFGPLVKDKVNPFYKSKYADLAALINLVEDPLLEQGIIISQPTMRWESGTQYIKTRLLHVSGDEEFSTLDIPSNLDPQKTVAAITYLKRAALQAILGIPAEDDDGNTAAGVGEAPKPPNRPPAPASGPGGSFTTDPRQQKKDEEKAKKPSTQLPADPAAGLANVVIQSIQAAKLNGIDVSLLKTPAGDYIVDTRKATAKDILKTAQDAAMSKTAVVIDYTTTASGNNVVKTVRMEG